MQAKFDGIKGVAATVCGTIATAVGGVDHYLKLLLIAMLVDMITGIANAIEHKAVSSATMRRGLLNKVIILFLVAIGVAIDNAFSAAGTGALTIGDVSILVRNIVIFWFFIEEFISILENCAKLGIPVPKVLRKVLKSMESGVSNSSPSALLDAIKRALNLNITFGDDKKSGKSTNSDSSESTKPALDAKSDDDSSNKA